MNVTNFLNFLDFPRSLLASEGSIAEGGRRAIYKFDWRMMSRKDNRKFGDRCVNIASRSNSAPSRAPLGLFSRSNQSLFSRVSISETAEREREREEEMEFRFFFLSNIFQADLSKFRSKLVCFESFNLQYCFLIFLFERRYILLEDIKKIILAAPKKVLGKWSAFTPHLRHGVY